MLGARRQNILRSLVEIFLETGEPVGSRTLSKAGVKASPATIRNEMADLEDEGYLVQPHASAGRIPTDKAFRFWVDSQPLEALDALERDNNQLKSLDEQFLSECRGLDILMENAVKILSEVSHLASVGSLPSFQSALARLQLVGLDSGHVMAVVISESGLAQSHILRVEHGLDQAELNKISNVINESYSKNSLKALLGGRISQIRHLEQEARDLTLKILGKLESALVQAETEVFYDGFSRVLKNQQGEGQGPKEFVQGFLSGELLSDLLKPSEGETLVRIGSETALEGFDDYALVASAYGVGNRTGTIGILGPKRMDYRRVIGVVNHMKRRLEEILS